MPKSYKPFEWLGVVDGKDTGQDSSEDPAESDYDATRDQLGVAAEEGGAGEGVVVMLKSEGFMEPLEPAATFVVDVSTQVVKAGLRIQVELFSVVRKVRVKPQDQEPRRLDIVLLLTNVNIPTNTIQCLSLFSILPSLFNTAVSP